ncbi:MAG: recombinase family protein [Phenylobacterium sp.]|nr:recombinase family protein [Phenylobacterium sp.]
MRYGIVRGVAPLPSAAAQRERLQAEGCDVIVEEGEPSQESERRLNKLLFGIKRGDEVLVCSLASFMRSTGELVQLLRDLLEIGATVRILDGETDGHALRPSEQATEVLTLLAEHEIRRPSRPGPRTPGRIGGGSRNKLSKYQTDYARKLHAEGQSLRAIGLLFQISPDEVWDLIGS